MNDLSGAMAAQAAVGSSRSVLTGLMASIGSSGLAAAARQPALLALIDQHSAAVRDSLRNTAEPNGGDGPMAQVTLDQLAAPRRVTQVALAGYAEGVRDVALEHGWQPPTAPVDLVDWPNADWVLIRLLAVCALARDSGIQP
ncbi:MAG TPA: DUF6401 family natural product biosynthesis protein [Micromonosporaceae bacterium]|nr:DUF6401 family natural product biosynthesis protein [Micromonosporaceae bacterium]